LRALSADPDVESVSVDASHRHRVEDDGQIGGEPNVLLASWD
jgi:hypothetical protein